MACYCLQAQAPDYSVSDVWSGFEHSEKHDKIVATSPDIFSALPDELSPLHKNPCWRQGTEGRLRCIPYYHIIGQSKCGTTDLYKRLSKHPQVYESLNKVRAEQAVAGGSSRRQ